MFGLSLSKNRIRGLAVGVVLAISSPALATFSAFPGPSNCNSGFSESMKSMIHRVSIKGEDNRISLKEKGANNPVQIAQLKADHPTRRFYCGSTGSEMSQANIVMQSDIIFVAAHSLYDKSCKPYSAAEAGQCVVVDNDGVEYPIDFSTVISGVQADMFPNGKCSLDSELNVHSNAAMVSMDWAVVKLSKPLPNVNPYEPRQLRLAYSNPPFADEGKSLDMVSGGAANFPGGKKKTMNFQTCGYRGHAGSGDFVYLKTDCDDGPGMSGSGLVTPGAIWGIHIRGTDSSKDGLPYDEHTNFSIVVPVTPKIMRAVESLTNGVPI